MTLRDRTVRFSLDAPNRAAPADVEVAVGQLVVAGWTGRDPDAVARHIRELQELGVTPPSSTPMFYRLSTRRLVTEPLIEVIGDRTSGEVEFVLVQAGMRLYVGVGSDHTDRAVEAHSVTVAKQMCDKPVAPTLWEFEDVVRHWDELMLRSWLVDGQERELYQEGAVSAVRAPAELIARYADNDRLPDGTVMFCGTLATRGGVRPSRRFEFEIEDPVRGSRIRHGYDVVALAAAE